MENLGLFPYKSFSNLSEYTGEKLEIYKREIGNT